MTSPSALEWDSWPIEPEASGGVAFGFLSLGPGVALEVSYLIRKSSHFKSVAACLESVSDELEFRVDLMPLCFKSTTLVVIAAVPLHFSDGVPVVEVGDGLAEGVKCGTRTDDEIVEPGWHRISGVGRIVRCEIKVNSEGLLVVARPSQEIHSSIVSLSDPLGVAIPLTDG